jgi:hypothetical protein
LSVDLPVPFTAKSRQPDSAPAEARPEPGQIEAKYSASGPGTSTAEIGYFWDQDLHAYLVPYDRVEFFFRRSVVMNGYRFDHGRFIVDGIGRERIGLYTHHDVRVEVGHIHDERVLRYADVVRRGGGRDDRRDGR